MDKGLPLVAEPGKLWLNQSRAVKLTLTNPDAGEIKDIVLSTKGGNDITVSPRSVHRDRLAAHGLWGVDLQMKALKSSETLQLPVSIYWQNPAGKRESFKTTLTFSITEASPVQPGPFRAFITGIDDYTDPRIAGASHQGTGIRTLAEFLTMDDTTGYGSRRVTFIPAREATVTRLQMQLAEFTAATNREETILFYFSGHMCRIQKDGAWRTYLCPRDAVLDDLDATAMRLDIFAQFLSRLTAQHALVILDICCTDSPLKLKSLAGYLPVSLGLSDEDGRSLSNLPGRAVLMACHEYGHLQVDRAPGFNFAPAHLVQTIKSGGKSRDAGAVYARDMYTTLNESMQRAGNQNHVVLHAHDPALNFPIALVPE